jgi:hypothetical protein
MTLAILISAAAVLFSTGYILRRQRLDTLEFRGGRIRLVRGQALAAEKADSTRGQRET